VQIGSVIQKGTDCDLPVITTALVFYQGTKYGKIAEPFPGAFPVIDKWPQGEDRPLWFFFRFREQRSCSKKRQQENHCECFSGHVSQN
jgi:hypothetical protein